MQLTNVMKKHVQFVVKNSCQKSNLLVIAQVVAHIKAPPMKNLANIAERNSQLHTRKLNFVQLYAQIMRQKGTLKLKEAVNIAAKIFGADENFAPQLVPRITPAPKSQQKKESALYAAKNSR